MDQENHKIRKNLTKNFELLYIIRLLLCLLTVSVNKVSCWYY